MNRLSLLLSGLFLVASCGDLEIRPLEPSPVPPATDEVSVCLHTATINDNFLKGESIGLYMSNHSDGASLPLMSSGNYTDNWKFTYDGLGGWTSDRKLYYEDEDAQVDFYAYFPYSEISDATRHDVSVPVDQSDEMAYRMADFIWGNTLNCQPGAGPINITLDHMLAKAVVILKPGHGFTENELIEVGPRVQIRGISCNATFDLGTGQLTEIDSPTLLMPYQHSALEYRAVLVPQHIEDTDLVEISIGAAAYKLRRTITFEKGKEYTFTVTIQRTEDGVNVGIGSWDVVSEDYGGVVS